MTKEELEKEAEEHCNEVLCSVCEKVTCTKKIKCREWRDRRAGYYCGAEPREKRIEELEKQIENMKCCGNCKHYTTFNNACMEYGYFLDRCDKTKWEIKEK